ncbi:ketopantoate reductase PanE/ApbA C terminal-domain-containing protein [Aspergillus cavernicola]|uniref:2-dehydropantoate 2-reductase n=1 Tax=Aspergillus cavernicola TaxID=176166 RepID=A0ABR4HR34_9EURO
MANTKVQVLLLGCGAVGTMAAVTLERSGRASVTAVLRSNFETVQKNGFTIDSVDHGKLSSWCSSHVVRSIQDAMSYGPFHFVVVAMKSLPDIYSIPKLIAPIMIAFDSTIVLIQNGIGNEQPFVDAFPDSTVLSGVSMIGARQLESGILQHDKPDILHIGPFYNPSVAKEQQDLLAASFASLYEAGGATCIIAEDIIWMRWKKLVWNASFNSVCAMTGLDAASIIDAGGLETMIRPVMNEIVTIAHASGYVLPNNIQELSIASMPREIRFRPSMLVDADRGNPMEIEVIVGNPLRMAQELGCETPFLRAIYGCLKIMQWKFGAKVIEIHEARKDKGETDDSI